MKKIKYKIKDGFNITNCPFGLRTFKNGYKKVGGRSCRQCKYFVSYDDDKKEVTCNNEKKVKRWVSRL